MKDFDLGRHSWTISTRSAEAQHYFDMGLNWTYGFNHEEGVRCFLRALAHDPTCAMAHWGVAYSSGPFYNMPWSAFSDEEARECTAWCYAHLRKARTLAHFATDVERAVIEALDARIQAPHPVPQDDFDQWDQDYADAMRQVYRAYPDHPDVQALFVEALMSRTPWRLWDTGTDQVMPGADTLEALAACESAINAADARGEAPHPALLHLHIHLLEMAPEPERALPSAGRLGPLCPDAGHMNHMPAHIYMQCGMYAAAKEVSARAIQNDRDYAAYAGPYNFYTWARSHDLHLMAVACCFLGQYDAAMAAANELREMLTPDVLTFREKPFLRNALDGYSGTDVHVMVRFGKWRALTRRQFDRCPDLYGVSTAMDRYGKALGHANLYEFGEAVHEIALFEKAVSGLNPNRLIHNNPVGDVLDVGREMLLGEFLYHSGDAEGGFEYLRRSVAKCDALAYAEPWPWMHPPATRWGRCCWNRGSWTRRRRCTGRIWGWMTRSSAVHRTEATSGPCAGWSIAWNRRSARIPICRTCARNWRRRNALRMRRSMPHVSARK